MCNIYRKSELLKLCLPSFKFDLLSGIYCEISTFISTKDDEKPFEIGSTRSESQRCSKLMFFYLNHCVFFAYKQVVPDKLLQ